MFKEILEELNKESLNTYLRNHSIYGVMKSDIDYILQQMKSLESVSTGAQLKMMKEDFEDSWGVVMEREGKIYAIDWAPWEEALGYVVDEEEVLKEVSLEEFVLMVLYDLTFDGVNYKKREDKISELISRIEG